MTGLLPSSVNINEVYDIFDHPLLKSKYDSSRSNNYNLFAYDGSCWFNEFHLKTFLLLYGRVFVKIHPTIVTAKYDKNYNIIKLNESVDSTKSFFEINKRYKYWKNDIPVVMVPFYNPTNKIVIVDEVLNRIYSAKH